MGFLLGDDKMDVRMTLVLPVNNGAGPELAMRLLHKNHEDNLKYGKWLRCLVSRFVAKN